jgi:peptide/nickel transport system substrate-binding protein
MSMTIRRIVALSLLALAQMGTARAVDLTIGRSTEQHAMDPHFVLLGNNTSTAENIFDRLVFIDPDLKMHPSLATSWRVIDPLTWEITLRPGVHFHDGSEMTAEDVAFSIMRPRNVKNSPASMGTWLVGVNSVEVTGKLTVRVKTDAPIPLLMDNIGPIFVVPAKTGPDAGNEEFNNGSKTIGTGPYRFVSRVPGERVDMVANQDYWGGKPVYDRVILKFISNDAARIAALLSGSVDVTERIPPGDITTLEQRNDISLFSVQSTRMIYLAVDSVRDVSPGITDRDGKPMDRNPLRDRRVRQALSMMINRDAIVSRVLSGAGVPAGQMVPDVQGGHDPALKPTPFDLDGAKKLLAEAGWGNGFGLTVHTSNNRVPKDGEVGQAIGQMFSRGGLRVQVEAMPYNVYVGQATAGKFSLFVFSYGSNATSGALPLAGILHTNDPSRNIGQLNRTRYTNPAYDKALAAAFEEFDETKRNAAMAAATRIAMEDFAILPLYWQKLYWAARKGFVVTPDRGESTSALYVIPPK